MTDDDAMLERLRRAAQAADPPPAELEGSARAAFGLGRRDEELAVLLHDSEEESVAVRSGGEEPHLLSFGSDGVGTDLEIAPSDDGHDITGTVHGPVHRAALQTPDEAWDVALDEAGRFRRAGVTGVAVRVRMETGDGVTVVTPWVRLR
jgi:hypothetical protein